MNKMQCIEQEILQNTCDIGDELKAIYYCLKLGQNVFLECYWFYVGSASKISL
jgi:hypothetical protein